MWILLYLVATKEGAAAASEELGPGIRMLSGHSVSCISWSLYICFIYFSADLLSLFFWLYK